MDGSLKIESARGCQRATGATAAATAVKAAAAAAATAGMLATAMAAEPLRLQASGDAAELSAYRDMVQAFKSVAPDIEVEFIPVGKSRDHMAKLATGFAAGNPPDLFLLNFRRFGQFAARGVLEPLGARLSQRGKFRESDYYAPAIEAFRFDGSLVCVPQNVSSLVVYYNVAHFQAAGLPPPAPNWTWADFQRTARQLTRDTNGDGKPDLYGFGFERTLIRLVPFIWQAGGDVVDDLNKPTRLTLDTPAATEALEFIRSFAVNKLTPSQAEHKSEDYEERFARGGIGMVLNSRRYTSLLRAAPNLDWDVAPLPRHANGSATTVLHSDAYCMAKASKNKDAAYRFLEFANGPIGSGLMARAGRTVPALKAAAESPDFLDPGKKPRSAKVFLDSIAQIRRTPNVAAWNEIESKADPLVEDWFFNPRPLKPLGLDIIEATQGLLGKP
jgi:multiple sugar transport system substrate-binding protein